MTPIRPMQIIESEPIGKRYWLHLAVIAALVALVHTMEYAEAMRMEAENNAARASKIDREFTQCLRGEWREKTVEGDEIGCMPVEINERMKQS